MKSAVYKDGMSRGAVVRFPGLTDALYDLVRSLWTLYRMWEGVCREFVRWTEREEAFRFMKQKFEETSRYGRLTSVKCNPTGRLVFVRFVAKTGDAMGMNMVSKVHLLPAQFGRPYCDVT